MPLVHSAPVDDRAVESEKQLADAIPSTPSTRIPTMMMSLRRKRLAEKIIQPSPFVAAISSAATTVEKAAASAIVRR